METITAEQYQSLGNKRNKDTTKYSESELQESCVRWFRYQYAQYIIYAIPNGGTRNVIEASRMKREGVLAGICDLHIPVPNKEFSSLYIEMKVGKNKPSALQVEMIDRLKSFGNKVEVCYTKEEFIKIVNEYFSNV